VVVGDGVVVDEDEEYDCDREAVYEEVPYEVLVPVGMLGWLGSWWKKA
jgi:hypothetical protein